MKTPTAALLAVVLGSASWAEDRAEWKEFTCKDGKFKVLMPAAPKQEEARTASDFGHVCEPVEIDD